MVPRTSSGRGFKGAAAYYLHDKSANTSDRVRFTHTLNLANDMPRRAVAEMIYTAEHASDLKAASGVKATGRKLEKPVYTFSLSWHPSEKPSDQQMQAAGLSALRALKMEHHQVLMVAHSDTAHAHVHLIVNRIDPDTGKAHGLNNDQLVLSKWAQVYEQEHGKTWCDDRVRNNADRDKASGKGRGRKFVKDLKSQERDARPEYDRRSNAAKVKQEQGRKRALRSVSLAQTAQRDSQRTAARGEQHRAGTTPQPDQLTGAAAAFLAARRGQKTPGQRDPGSVSPHVLNHMQDRHNAERQALSLRFETRKDAADALIESAYGPERRQHESRLAVIATREQQGSWLSKAIDRKNNLAGERDALERGLADIARRSRSILSPVECDHRAAVNALSARQLEEKRRLEEPPPLRPELIKTPEPLPIEKKLGPDRTP